MVSKLDSEKVCTCLLCAVCALYIQNIQCTVSFVYYLCYTGSSEGHYDGHDIDSKLKLQEFWDAVIDISPPHHSFHYAGKVVICQDNIRGLFGHICSSNALKKCNKTTWKITHISPVATSITDCTAFCLFVMINCYIYLSNFFFFLSLIYFFYSCLTVLKHKP